VITTRKEKEWFPTSVKGRKPDKEATDAGLRGKEKRSEKGALSPFEYRGVLRSCADKKQQQRGTGTEAMGARRTALQEWEEVEVL